MLITIGKRYWGTADARLFLYSGSLLEKEVLLEHDDVLMITRYDAAALGQFLGRPATTHISFGRMYDDPEMPCMMHACVLINQFDLNSSIAQQP
jgi:hypothetical protein